MSVSFRKSSGFGESLPDMTNWMSLFWPSSILLLLLSCCFRTRLHFFQTRPNLFKSIGGKGVVAAITIELAIKIILCIACVCKIARKKEKARHVFTAIGICIGVFYFSNILASLTEITDVIKIEALSQRNESAGNDEILVAGVTIDQEFQTLPKPVNGKWFLVGNDYYMWRSEQDGRRPDGVTDEVEFPIPVGYDRKITFIKMKKIFLIQ